MDRTGDDLLTGAALSFDQQVRCQITHLCHRLQKCFDRFALAYNTLEPITRLHFTAQPLQLTLQTLLLERTLDLNQDLFVVKRLGYIMERTRGIMRSVMVRS